MKAAWAAFILCGPARRVEIGTHPAQTCQTLAGNVDLEGGGPVLPTL
jgi:hypothetical protein